MFPGKEDIPQHSLNDPDDTSVSTAIVAANIDVESDLDKIDVIEISKDDAENEIIPMEINSLENGEINTDSKKEAILLI